MGKVLLVTGTDTGVGKTVVTAWLGLVLRGRYRPALVKAVQTGADPLVDGDEASYRAMLGDSDVTTATVCRLPDPLAPSIAARRAGTKVDFEGVAAACLDIASLHAEFLTHSLNCAGTPVSNRLGRAFEQTCDGRLVGFFALYGNSGFEHVYNPPFHLW